MEARLALAQDTAPHITKLQFQARSRKHESDKGGGPRPDIHNWLHSHAGCRSHQEFTAR
jgi:hypothetical protein